VSVQTPEIEPVDSPSAAQESARTRVLIVAHSANEGGAEHCLDTVLRHLDRSRFEAIVVFACDGPMADSARRLGYDVRIMPLSWWLFVEPNRWYFKNLLGGAWSRVRRLAQLVRDEHIDLVYSNTAVVFEGAAAARRAGVPHVWHIHEVLDRRGGLRPLAPLAWIQRFVRRHSQRVIFESRAARDVFERTAPLPQATVVPNSLRFSPDDATPTRREARQALELPDNAWIVGCVGQLIDRKNPLLAVDAFSKLAGRSDAFLVIAGEGPLRPQVEVRLAAHGLTDRCRLLPFQRDVRTLLAALDVPAVACRSQGPEEIILDGETGLLTPQEDAAALAAALDSLQADPERARAMGAAARRHVSDQFDPERNTRAIEAIWTEAIGAQSTTRGPQSP
jgi:glycosyltransferase involved in cell wall biosynthesis